MYDREFGQCLSGFGAGSERFLDGRPGRQRHVNNEMTFVEGRQKFNRQKRRQSQAHGRKHRDARQDATRVSFHVAEE